MSESSPVLHERSRSDSSPPPDFAQAPALPTLTKAQKQAEKLARKAERAEIRRRKEERRRMRESGATEKGGGSGDEGSDNEKEEGYELGNNEKEEVSESGNTERGEGVTGLSSSLLVPESPPPPITQSVLPTSPISEVQTPLPPFSQSLNRQVTRQPLSSYTPPSKTPKPKNGKILGRIALTPPPEQDNVPNSEFTLKRKSEGEGVEVEAQSRVGDVKKVKSIQPLITATQPTPLIRKKRKEGVPLVSDSEAETDVNIPTKVPQPDTIPETILPDPQAQLSQTSLPKSTKSTTRPISETIPKHPNAKAGPSTSTSKLRPTTPNPFAKTPSKSKITRTRTSTSQSIQTNKAESDEQLRQSFKTPGAMNAYLASGWINLQELKRLEEAVISYKKGKFSEGEKGKLREALGLFKHMNRLSDDELVDIIMAKGRNAERKDYPKFWPELAANVPGRPVKYVKDHVKREYDPRGNKGSWTRDEDVALLRAYQTHPNEWAKIAVIVDRTEQNVRDRWLKELRDRPTRETGHWTREEELELIKHVKETNQALGQDPLGLEGPWDLISEKMGGKRTLTQCRIKWRDQLRPAELEGEARPGRFGLQEKKKLIARLRMCKVSSTDDIPWEKITWDEHRRKTLREAFTRMKSDVPAYRDLSFSELLDKVEAGLMERIPKEVKKMKSGKSRDSTSRIVSKEMVDDSGSSGSESESGSGEEGSSDEDTSGSSSEVEIPQVGEV